MTGEQVQKAAIVICEHLTHPCQTPSLSHMHTANAYSPTRMVKKEVQGRSLFLLPRHFAHHPNGESQYHWHGVVPNQHSGDDGVYDDVCGSQGYHALIYKA